MPTVKLASENLKSQAGYSLVSPQPGMRSSAPIDSLQSARVDPNAGTTQFTKMPVPSIVADTTLSSGAKMATIWADAAFKFQQRKEEADAQAAIMTAQEQFNRALYGGEDHLGFSALDGGAAVDGYGGYDGSLRNISGSILGPLPKGVQTKAAAKIKQLEESFRTRGAQHKVAQQDVYERNIMEAQAATIRADVVSASASPKDFLDSKARAIGELSTHFPGQPEALLAAAQAFQTTLYEDVIKSHTGSGNYELAQQYLDMGVIDRADSIMLAERQAILNAAKEKSNDDAWTAYTRARIVAKNEREDEQRDKLKMAAKAGDPAILYSISDVDLRGKAIDAFEKSFETPTSRPDYAKMMANYTDYVINPHAALDMKDGLNISFDDRASFMAKVISDQKAGVTDLKREGRRWVDSFFVNATKGISGKYDQASAEQASLMMTSRIDEAIEDAVKNNVNPTEALYRVQQELMSNPEVFKSYPEPTFDMRPVELPGGHVAFSGMSDITAQVEVGMISVQDAANQLQQQYGLSQGDVLQKYGLGEMLGKDLTGQERAEIIARVLPDQRARTNLYRDLSELAEQRLFHYRQFELMNKGGPSLSEGSVGSGSGDFGETKGFHPGPNQ